MYKQTKTAYVAPCGVASYQPPRTSRTAVEAESKFCAETSINVENTKATKVQHHEINSEFGEYEYKDNNDGWDE